MKNFIYTLITFFTLILTSSFSQVKLWGVTSIGGANNGGTIGYYDPNTNAWFTEYSFVLSSGNSPKGSLSLFQGKLYGMTSKGGSSNKGVIFEYDPQTKVYTKKIDFNGVNGSTPFGSLTLFNNKFYGMTYGGGNNGYGVAFEWDPITNVFTKKIDFDSNGGQPKGSLLLHNGSFYGMTNLGSWENGTVFKWDPTSGTFNKVALYGSGASNPEGSLIKFGSKFYGLTRWDNLMKNGALIEWDGATSIKTVPFEIIGNPTGSLTAVNSKLYGLASESNTTHGQIFSWNPISNKITVLANFNGSDGSSPFGSLSYSNGKLYGFTYAGGTNNLGTIFEFNITTNTIQKKIDLDNGTGGNPYSTQLIEISSQPISQTINFDQISDKTYGDSDFTLYGTASSGLEVTYTSSDPTVAIVTDNKVKILKAGITTITASQTGNSYYAAAPNVQRVFTIQKFTPSVAWEGGLADLFHGTPLTKKQLGATSSIPGIFTYNPPIGTILGVGNNQQLSVTFNPSDLTNYNSVTKQNSINVLSPPANDESLVQTRLWGVTSTGGLNDGGTIGYFGVTSGVWTTVYNFEQATGITPLGSLVQFNGKLYGMTSAGGSSNKGVIFEFDPNTKTYTKKIDFVSTNGAKPKGSLTLLNNKFYGMTYAGGADDLGVLFDWDPITNEFNRNISFGLGGGMPDGSLTIRGGLLYGLTGYGGCDIDPVYWNGTIFSWNPETKMLAENACINHFDAGNGYAAGSLTRFHSNLYGIWYYGHGTSQIFEYSGSGPNITKIAGLGSFSGGFIQIGEKLVGATSLGTIVEFDPTSKNVSSLGVGSGPSYGTPILSNGKLYLLSNSGGSSNMGVLCEFDMVTRTKTRQFNFNYSTGGNPKYTQLLEIAPANKLTPEINWNNPASIVYGTALNNTQLNATSSVAGSFSYFPASGTILKVGSHTLSVTFTPTDAANYNTVTQLVSINVTKATQYITFPPISDKTSGDDKFVLQATASSGLATTFETDSYQLSISGDSALAWDAGRVTVSAYQNGNENYNAATPVSQSFCIKPVKPIVVMDRDNLGRIVLVNIFSNPNYSYQWYLNGNPISGANGDQLTASLPGSYELQAKVDDCLSDFSEPETISNNKLTPTIIWNNPADITYGTALGSQQLNASSSIAGSFSYSPASGTVLDAGENQTLSVTFTPTDANNYNIATKQVMLNVAKAPQQITFAPITTKTFGDGNFLLNASASSGLAPTFESASDKLSISGNNAGILKAGRATVSASQAGNENYQASTPVSQSFCIRPAKPTISVDNTNPANIVLLSSANTGNQWYLNNSAIPNATGQTLTLQSSGSYKVQVSADDCLSEFSEAQTVVVTEVASGSQGISLFPNPAVGNRITVRSESSGAKQVKVMSVTGKEMDSKETSSTEVQFDISSYANGIYIVKVQTENTVSFVRFIKA